ncbi:hypothetical protein HDF08_000066 [Edaphobacter lichenicola]|uniref:Uncharacterized protein n=1 Tax=Tunturiibacter lichenicola TaxID=2051959 RepID=A0A852VB25_9BACT|nr:hypothetical protein [Edaphobacter lichenicola]
MRECGLTIPCAMNKPSHDSRGTALAWTCRRRAFRERPRYSADRALRALKLDHPKPIPPPLDQLGCHAAYVFTCHHRDQLIERTQETVYDADITSGIDVPRNVL